MNSLIISKEEGGQPPPKLTLPERDLRAEQDSARWKGLPLPYPGLPRDYVDQVLAVVIRFEPDKVFLFGSVARGEDTVSSDIDLLIAVDDLPLKSWKNWSVAIERAARPYCPFKVDAKITDVEDLERRKSVVTSPCMWVRQEGILLYDREQGKRNSFTSLIKDR
ncbi:MAG: nucleotidyltransferase domain-containing protein [Acidimicrobiia bacterium]|nr:nucleotidyltransferase domain-containing protein [bacterium]MXX65322.1 nucleotidyltransferase domain-containing protein [Acidimicrobiia bacterium]MCY3579753.1 nucleotidyltransferase domain-containing protein [bacterium]MCY3652964.1 nucleotidyltransferase domain-containing protein [bacterium]MXZ06142.1 nucleotidyltransferase domain-containing protein [Acidimicrobiia bacterium]